MSDARPNLCLILGSTYARPEFFCARHVDKVTPLPSVIKAKDASRTSSLGCVRKRDPERIPETIPKAAQARDMALKTGGRAAFL